MITTFFSSSLESFVVHPLVVVLGLTTGIDFTVTNMTVTLITLFFSLFYFSLSLLSKKDFTFFIVPHRFQSFIEFLYSKLLSLVLENISGNVAPRYFPLVFFIFLYIFLLNGMGLISYTFTVTSHLAITVYFSLSLFIGINIIGFRRNGLNLFSLFLPDGTSFVLAFLLVPIEFVSYAFRPVSLAIRLFANMMAGHTLLHVMVSFSYLMIVNGLLSCCLPALITLPLLILEAAVCLIQAYVFSLLTCIYLNDSINLH